MKPNLRAALVVFLSLVGLAACNSGGGGDGGASTPAMSVSGTVLAPGGQLAFNSPTGLKRFFAGIFGAPAYAAISGTLPVGAGITVTLIEIDANGDQVGSTIATTTTDAGGNYTLDVPQSFVPASRYVVRAEGPSSHLDAIVTATSDLEIDPISHVTTEQIVAATGDLSTISTQEVQILREELSEIAQGINPSGLSLSALNAQITQETANDEELGYMLANAALGGGTRICGQVTHQVNPHAGIHIVVRDFGDWVTRARTTTDASGSYCVDIAAGNYIVGALNTTGTSFAASEWWSVGGTAYQMIDAGKVTVTSGTTTADFVLETGGRIEGTVAASGGTLNGQPLEGIQVEVRDFRTGLPVAIVKTDASGNYRINVIPGGNGYALSVLNRSWRPYASHYHNGTSGGVNNSFEASKVTVGASTTQAILFAMTPGNQVTARLLDQPAVSGGLPVPGMQVRVNINYAVNPYSKTGAAARLRTNRDGTIRLWLKPDSYVVQTRGQEQPADLTSGNQELSFEQTVGRATVTIKDGGGNPVSQAKLFLYDSAGNFVNYQPSLADGSATLYAPTNGNYLLEVRVDDGRPYGSIIYNNKLSLLAGNPVSMTVGGTTGLGDIVLPTAGILKGTVRYANNALAAAVRVQVRYGGIDDTARFISVYARGDGTYEASVPAATYNRVRAGGTSGTNADNVAVTAGGETTNDFTLP